MNPLDRLVEELRELRARVEEIGTIDWSDVVQRDAALARREREYLATKARLRREDPAGPWALPGAATRFFDDCPWCGCEVTFGWDEGHGWPDGSAFETDCARCGAELRWHFSWSPRVFFHGAAEVTKAGTTIPQEDDDDNAGTDPGPVGAGEEPPAGPDGAGLTRLPGASRGDDAPEPHAE